MSAPPRMMLAFPVAWLGLTAGGALSVAAALVAVGIFVSIVLTCVAAAHLSTGKGRRV